MRDGGWGSFGIFFSHQSEKEQTVATKGGECIKDSHISRRRRLAISLDVGNGVGGVCSEAPGTLVKSQG